MKFQIGAKGSNPQLGDDCKVGADLEKEPGNDNIPLRIILLMMDEVFDLQERNQWLRRQIVAVLRTLIKAMFGDIANRKIVDYFAQMTSPETLCSYLESFKQSLWPNGTYCRLQFHNGILYFHINIGSSISTYVLSTTLLFYHL